jgi:hypothetical protein
VAAVQLAASYSGSRSKKITCSFTPGVEPAEFEMESQMEMEAASEDIALLNLWGPLGSLQLGFCGSRKDRVRCNRLRPPFPLPFSHHPPFPFHPNAHMHAHMHSPRHTYTHTHTHINSQRVVGEG